MSLYRITLVFIFTLLNISCHEKRGVAPESDQMILDVTPVVFSEKVGPGSYYIFLEMIEEGNIEELLMFLKNTVPSIKQEKVRAYRVNVLTDSEVQPVVVLKNYNTYRLAEEAIKALPDLPNYFNASYVVSQENYRKILGNRGGLSQYYKFLNKAQEK